MLRNVNLSWSMWINVNKCQQNLTNRGYNWYQQILTNMKNY